MFKNASTRTRTLLRIGLYGGFLFVGIPLAFAHVMTKTFPLESLASPPRGFEAVALESEELSLRGWLSGTDAGATGVVLTHGLGDSIEAYAAHAVRFRERGHNVLLVDLRGHGGSEGSIGTLGARERADVEAGIQTLRDRGLARRGLILVGHSMGAVAVLRAAVRAEDVVAVIVEAPYDNFRSNIAHHAWLEFKVPAWAPFTPLAIGAAEWIGGFDADDVDAVAAIAGIDAPILAIAGGEDPQMPPATVKRVCDANPRCDMWVAAGVGHLGAAQRDDYWPRVEKFLQGVGL